jgi:ABC-type sugar transport system ATPase subunit
MAFSNSAPPSDSAGSTVTSSSPRPLVLTDVHKRFGAVVALNGASLRLRPGTVHALIGGNGSGKSTFAKILTAVLRPDRATFRQDGSEPAHYTAATAAHLRVAGTYQEVSLVPDLSVAENLFLSRLPYRVTVRRLPRSLRASATEVLDRLLLPASVLDTKVRDLPLDQRALTELAKVLLTAPRVLIMDELTASLRAEQVEQVGKLLKELSAQGVATLFVSHRLEELVEFCSSCTVFRNGVTVLETDDIGKHTMDEYVSAMTATNKAVTAARRHRRGTSVDTTKTLIDIRDLVVPGWAEPVSFTVQAGEIVGLGGLAGNGQSDLLRAIFRAAPGRNPGVVALEQKKLSTHSLRDSVRHGIGFISGDRENEMAFGHRTVAENFTVISHATRRARPDIGLLAKMRVVGRPDQAMRDLSGGNQQKVIVGRWLAMKPRVLLADDPTRGVDIATRDDIHALLRDLADHGAAVILTSSDDRELADICDRAYVLYGGRIVKELAGEEVTEEELGRISTHPDFHVRA